MTKSEYNKELAELRARLEELENAEIEEDEPVPPHPSVFYTQAETEFTIERLEVIAEMSEWAGRGGNDPFVLSYNHLTGDLSAKYAGIVVLTYGEMRFATLADAQKCIKVVGEERIKKYYFGVPEDE